LYRYSTSLDIDAEAETDADSVGSAVATRLSSAVGGVCGVAGAWCTGVCLPDLAAGSGGGCLGDGVVAIGRGSGACSAGGLTGRGSGRGVAGDVTVADSGVSAIVNRSGTLADEAGRMPGPTSVMATTCESALSRNARTRFRVERATRWWFSRPEYIEKA